MREKLQNTKIMAIAACLLWASAFVAIKIGLKYMPPFQFAGIRFMISGVMIALFGTQLSNYRSHVKGNYKQILSTSLFNTVLLYAFFYTGVAKVPAALAALIIGSQPLFIAVVSHFVNHNDRLTKGKLTSILIGIVGLVMTSYNKLEFSAAGGTVLFGTFLLLLNNFSAAIGNIIVARNKTDMPALVFSSAQLFLGGAILLLLGLFTEKTVWSFFPGEFYASLGWLSFLSASAIGIWFVLLHRPGVKVSELNMWKFIIPVFGALLSWIILPDESPDTLTILGMGVLTSSLLLLNYINRKRNR